MSSFDDVRQILAYWAARSPDRTFLIAPDDALELSFSEVQRAAQAFAQHLRSTWQIGKGDHVGLLLPNGAPFVVAYLGIMSLGAVACPINTQLQNREVEYILRHARVAVLCTGRDAAARAVRWIGAGTHVRGVCLADDLLLGWLADGRLSAPAGAETLPRLDGGDVAQMLYTSGTTGRPKGVMITHRNLVRDCQYIVAWHRMGPEDRSLCILPLFHANAEILSLLCSLHAGGSVVVPRQFHASQLWNLAARYGATWCSAAPTIFWILLEAQGTQPMPRHGVRYFISGSAPLPVPLQRRFEETFGALILEGYGLTETTCRVTFNPHPPREVARPGLEEGYRRFGSVGLPIGDAETAIVDDRDRPLGAGERGEIVLRGSVLMKGYFDDPAATAEAFRGGWFHTGDIGYRDADGYLYIVDRKKDMIIRGGQNIYPREVDDVLLAHPQVLEAAVVGVPHEKYGEEVKAFVVLRDGARCAAEELIAYCRERLAAYKCPKAVHFVDALPKSATGKILRRRLLELYPPG